MSKDTQRRRAYSMHGGERRWRVGQGATSVHGDVSRTSAALKLHGSPRSRAMTGSSPGASRTEPAAASARAPAAASAAEMSTPPCHHSPGTHTIWVVRRLRGACTTRAGTPRLEHAACPAAGACRHPGAPPPPRRPRPARCRRPRHPGDLPTRKRAHSSRLRHAGASGLELCERRRSCQEPSLAIVRRAAWLGQATLPAGQARRTSVHGSRRFPVSCRGKWPHEAPLSFALCGGDGGCVGDRNCAVVLHACGVFPPTPSST